MFIINVNTTIKNEELYLINKYISIMFPNLMKHDINRVFKHLKTETYIIIEENSFGSIYNIYTVDDDNIINNINRTNHISIIELYHMFYLYDNCDDESALILIKNSDDVKQLTLFLYEHSSSRKLNLLFKYCIGEYILLTKNNINRIHTNFVYDLLYCNIKKMSSTQFMRHVKLKNILK